MNIINFSGGRTSAYMTKRLIDEGLKDYLVIFTNTGKEMPETLNFINECDIRWNLNIVWLEYRFGSNFEIVNYNNASRNGRPFDELIAYNKYFLQNAMMRYCTNELKIQTEKRYLRSLDLKEWTIYNGIRYDEPRRQGRIKGMPNYIDLELPLVKWKITKKDVLDWWKNQDFDLQVNEPYGNCDCCFLKGKGKLAIIAKEKPELLDWWIKQEEFNINSINKKGSKYKGFKSEITYQQIKENAKLQIGLWDEDPSFECFCNID
jgi:3'-phosphoadenosine 5'-phosphosulfate sulfotransferase (PAPS reductase)/FAD synthetase